MSDSTPKTILLAEDDASNVRFLRMVLEESGYNLIVAENGNKALEITKNEKPDLILLDIMMPEMDGFEVCRNLKASPGTIGIPVIFLTARTNTEDIVKGFEVGGVDYVTKPFSAHELLARIRTHIEMRVLKGLIPICASCKKIRDDEGYWDQIDEYLRKHSDIEFSHGLCLDCMDRLYGGQNWYRKKKESESG